MDSTGDFRRTWNACGRTSPAEATFSRDASSPGGDFSVGIGDYPAPHAATCAARPRGNPPLTSFTMSNYHDYLKQIEDLKAKAESARKEEIAAVIADIKQKIKLYALSAQDLGLAEKKPRGRPAKAAAAADKPAAKKPGRKARGTGPQKGVKRRVKYKGPQGQPWTGVGRKPQWVVQALAEGKSLSDFEVKQ
jgi:DNA-binding protein H-NS